jgi:hypothetical protein
VNLEVEGPAPPGNRPEDSAATKPPIDSPTIPRTTDIPGYVVIMITRYGMPRRKVYLDLGHARAAVARARGKGQQAWMVLCRLEPVVADLDDEVTG